MLEGGWSLVSHQACPERAAHCRRTPFRGHFAHRPALFAATLPWSSERICAHKRAHTHTHTQPHACAAHTHTHMSGPAPSLRPPCATRRATCSFPPRSTTQPRAPLLRTLLRWGGAARSAAGGVLLPCCASPAIPAAHAERPPPAAAAAAPRSSIRHAACAACGLCLTCARAGHSRRARWPSKAARVRTPTASASTSSSASALTASRLPSCPCFCFRLGGAALAALVCPG